MWKGYSLLFSLFVWLADKRLFGNKITDAHKARIQQQKQQAHFTGGILVHCASYGEYEQGIPFLELLRSKYPSTHILLTFSSPSGYNAHHSSPLADAVVYIPWDSKKAVTAFLDKWKPMAIFHIKYEYWPNWIFEASNRNIPLGVVSAIFNTPPPSWQIPILKAINHFFVQNTATKHLLSQAGISCTSVVGDTRHARVISVAEQSISSSYDALLRSYHKPILIAGSIWQEDMEWIMTAFSSLEEGLCLILPHELNKENIDQITALIPEDMEQIDLDTDSLLSNQGLKVAVIPKMGILKTLYSLGDIAYIGGGFGKGIHNTLEAAVYQIPVVSGPRIQSFPEALKLETLGVLHVASGNNALSLFSQLLKKETIEYTRVAAQTYFEDHKSVIPLLDKGLDEQFPELDKL